MNVSVYFIEFSPTQRALIISIIEGNMVTYLTADQKTIDLKAIDLKDFCTHGLDMDRVDVKEMQYISLLSLQNIVIKSFSNMSKSDCESLESMQLATRLCSIISKIPAQKTINQFLIILFTHYRAAVLGLCCFQLSNGGNLSLYLNLDLPVEVRMLSLKIMSAYLQSADLGAEMQHLAPFILMACYDRSNALRSVGLQILKTLHSRSESRELSHGLHINRMNLETVKCLNSEKASLLMSKVLERHAEILGDWTQLPSYIGELCKDRYDLFFKLIVKY